MGVEMCHPYLAWSPDHPTKYARVVAIRKRKMGVMQHQHTSKRVTYHCIEVEAIHSFPIIQVIRSVVFAAGCNLKPVGVFVFTLLQASDIARCIFAREQWILSWSLLASTPSGIPEYVHIWGPIGQPC